jgi:hypothetical protein
VISRTYIDEEMKTDDIQILIKQLLVSKTERMRRELEEKKRLAEEKLRLAEEKKKAKKEMTEE